LSSLLADTQTEAAIVVARLDRWLQTMRGPGGYAGPISHWWESSFVYCGPMADWRYEGIVRGYVTLYRSTSDPVWRHRATVAGRDLLLAQLPSGSYRNSAFQQGPMEGGTPHEAAVDLALLELARLLRELGDDEWETFYRSAEHNIDEYLLGRLWDGTGFVDQPWHRVHVPNKNATTIEALILFEAMSGRDMTPYVDPAARVIVSAQERGGPRSGATVHLGTGRHRLAVGFYTARSLCALLRLHERSPNDRWRDATRAGLAFLRGLYSERGIYFGRYPDGRLIANPRMVAAAGDVLRLLEAAMRQGLAEADEIHAVVTMLARSQLESGGLPTAFGFAGRGGRSAYHGPPEFRDVLPVVGWCDKAFSGLAMVAGEAAADTAAVAADEATVACLWKGRRCVYEETASHMALIPEPGPGPIFRWEKGACYPTVNRL
jgi:hypothetical protein